jgi:hypothetical protein
VQSPPTNPPTTTNMGSPPLSRPIVSSDVHDLEIHRPSFRFSVVPTRSFRPSLPAEEGSVTVGQWKDLCYLESFLFPFWLGLGAYGG